MKKRSEHPHREDLFTKLIGLGESSLQKSYYPQLQKKIQELEKSERRYRLLAEHVSDVIWLLDATGNIKFISPSVMTLLGRSDRELHGCHVSTLVSTKAAAELEALIQNLTRGLSDGSDDENQQVELELLDKDGRPCWVEIMVSVFLEEYSSESQVICVARDISKRKVLQDEKRDIQQQLFHSQKMESIGTLAGGIAHDFNNLLTVINGFSDLVLEKTNEEHSFYKELCAIRDAGRRAAEMTKQLLAFSRKQTVKPEIISINHAINSLERFMRRLIGEDIDVHYLLDESIPTISADRSQLDQVLTNLIVNARDALNAIEVQSGAKKILIESGLCRQDHSVCCPALESPDPSSEGPCIFFSVSDNGVGMDEQTRKKVFEPFFTTKPKHSGTGLGLATVYGIVKQNLGSIQVQSEKGEGSTFTVYWPIRTKDEDRHPVSVKENGATSGQGERILLVEDDPRVCAFTESCLTALGYQVTTAFDGKEALQRLERERFQFDLVITDVVMPQMNGKAMVDQLHKIEPDLPVIFMSGYTGSVISQKDLSVDEVRYLQKPFSKQQLACMVREALD